MLLNFVSSETNLAIILNNTCLIDIDVTTHISITIQDCFRSRLLIDDEKYIYMGCDKKARIEAICVFRFYLGTNIFLDLKNTFIVPSLR